MKYIKKLLIKLKIIKLQNIADNINADYANNIFAAKNIKVELDLLSILIVFIFGKVLKQIAYLTLIRVIFGRKSTRNL